MRLVVGLNMHCSLDPVLVVRIVFLFVEVIVFCLLPLHRNAAGVYIHGCFGVVDVICLEKSILKTL